MSSKKGTKQSFENSLRRLEAIVDTLEQGEIPLEKAIALYEEGIELSKICGEKLKTTELKLKKLSKSVEGQFKLIDLDGEHE